MEKVYKSVTGWKTEDDKHESTHVLLTVLEYNNLLNEIQNIKESEKQVQKKANIKVNEAREETKEAEEAVMSAAEKIQKLNDEVNKLKEQLIYEQKLNENFYRIATERANKARKINKHDKGYLFLNWCPFCYKYMKKSGEKTKIILYNLYKISVQTPWDCSLREEHINKRISDDLKGGNLVISNLHDVKWFTNNIDLDTAIDRMNPSDKMILRRQYRSNAKTGLWEVTFITNFEPGIVEKHRNKYV